ncbi:MAG TPA: glycoside hydrolase family 88 protein [Opitutaceae bacterium]|nr:glycoside hydrolase family 88 protein [Opitutaceae bacterium]
MLIVTALVCPGKAQQKFLSDWPTGASPTEVGKRVAERFVATPHPRQNTIIYPEVCAWYGALTFAALSHDTSLQSRLVQRFDKLVNEESKLIHEANHVDYSVLGAVPFEVYIQTKDTKALALGKKFADTQWMNPTPEGLTDQTRFWIDDMFMVTALQVQAYRATHDAVYVDRAATEMAAYLDKLQQPTGLFYHAPDVPFYWGRGDGWVAVGMAELLRSLPDSHPKRVRIMDGYKAMMASLLKYQGQDGLWRQLIDHPEAWPETSCTGMFTFAMITGVKNGWLEEKTYGPAARKGWLGLVSYINADGDVKEVCEGTNKKNDLDYYLTRARKVGDMHGQAPILWSASALLR